MTCLPLSCQTSVALVPLSHALALELTLPLCPQGCVEIIYLSVQSLIYCSIVYWMCWFQRDAGELKAGLRWAAWRLYKSATASLCLLLSTSSHRLLACRDTALPSRSPGLSGSTLAAG